MRAAVILLPLMSVGESEEYMNIPAVQDWNIKEHAADRGKLAIARLFQARNCVFVDAGRRGASGAAFA
jgi:hypothetical protein